ncbi:MAG: hypothetical protein JO058_04105 [Alphaproteobacteria bacterium]|nr:hypothetical protein [Alphaproteobacteria bacterium]MBV9967519.1 hypothetical protein [Alphaproteobacteria bacterium]
MYIDIKYNFIVQVADTIDLHRHSRLEMAAAACYMSGVIAAWIRMQRIIGPVLG